MKNISVLSLILALMLYIPHAYAAATLPATAVWSTPASAIAGDPIALNAFVYNDTADQVTVTVTFSANNTVVATASGVIIPGRTAKVATAEWLMPTTETTVTAAVPTARTATKKEVLSLEGVLGAVVLGGTPDIANPANTSARGVASTVVNVFETYRIREYNYFDALKEKSKEVLKTTTLSDVGTIIRPETAQKAPIHTVDYIQFAYATAGKAFFGQKALYYVVIILAILFIIRFIFSRLL